MNASIITIGDELMIGQIVNTNASFIAEGLNAIGIDITRMLTVGDDLEKILGAFREGLQASDVVIVTGGLGPTHDDITKKAVCRFFDTDLVLDQKVQDHIRELLHGRNMPWTAHTQEQSMVPRGSLVIPNRYGTAAGILFEQGGKHFIVLPGVPYEMESMMNETVVPLLRAKAKADTILHRTLRTTGIPESQLAMRLGGLGIVLGEDRLAFLPSPRGVRLRITVKGTDRDRCGQRVNEIETYIRERAGEYIYGTEQEELEAVVGRLLTERSLTIAVAESCTGGLITDRLTDVPGSSRYFERGLITYSNASKTDLLGVPGHLIDTRGAVSEEVARAMASGVRTAAHTDIGLATTGIAGPTGGSPEKPVGLVWIGYAGADGAEAIHLNFGGTRRLIKERASQAALDLVRRKVLTMA
jgi:nicotinamide-nucleotide amidase